MSKKEEKVFDFFVIISLALVGAGMWYLKTIGGVAPITCFTLFVLFVFGVLFLHRRYIVSGEQDGVQTFIMYFILFLGGIVSTIAIIKLLHIYLFFSGGY